jgi:hypothetical protein
MKPGLKELHSDSAPRPFGSCQEPTNALAGKGAVMKLHREGARSANEPRPKEAVMRRDREGARSGNDRGSLDVVISRLTPQNRRS